MEDVARAIDEAEARVRAAVPAARMIYLEPDLERTVTPSMSRTSARSAVRSAAKCARSWAAQRAQYGAYVAPSRSIARR